MVTLFAVEKTFYSEQDVHQVTVPGADGDFGILASHVPTLTVLRPGVVTVMESASGAGKNFFGMSEFAILLGTAVCYLALPGTTLHYIYAGACFRC